MQEKLKLNCPMCNDEFITTRRDKIWCSTGCSNKLRRIGELRELNARRQDMMKNEAYYYDFGLNKFFIKSLMPKNK